MEWQTKVHIAPAGRKIAYADRILSLGSCFADSVAAKMREYCLPVVSNPFGTLYNPLSIAQAVQGGAERDLVFHDGLYHSLERHGSFSFADRQEAEKAVRDSALLMRRAWEEATVVIVTFGTAWVYEYEGRVVANCHKLPASRFTRRRLGVDEIVDTWTAVMDANSGKHFIFTVSPIRHVKDGLHENQLSKGILLQAVERLTARGADYFPAYEIVLDELRDYRYYAEDMVHPSPAAVSYIWERFVETCMDAPTVQEMQMLHRFYLDKHHRLLHPDSPAGKAFLARVAETEKRLREKGYPV